MRAPHDDLRCVRYLQRSETADDAPIHRADRIPRAVGVARQMSADPEKSALKRRAIERMFEHARQPVSELPTVRAVLDAASNRIAKTVSDAIGHDIQVSSAIAQEVTPLEAVVRCEALVAVEYRVQPWAFSGIAGLAPELVFGWLDSMFGGDGSAPPPALAR